ncbi:MAG: hypothetical protein ACMG6S_06275, partial [Byssovorax sp.]
MHGITFTRQQPRHVGREQIGVFQSVVDAIEEHLGRRRQVRLDRRPQRSKWTRFPLDALGI